MKKDKLGFLQSSTGEKSSKRLAFLSSLPFVYIGTLWLCDRMIQSDHADSAVALWNSFLLLVAAFGGFVTSEMFIKIFGKKK